MFLFLLDSINVCPILVKCFLFSLLPRQPRLRLSAVNTLIQNFVSLYYFEMSGVSARGPQSWREWWPARSGEPGSSPSLTRKTKSGNQAITQSSKIKFRKDFEAVFI